LQKLYRALHRIEQGKPFIPRFKSLGFSGYTNKNTLSLFATHHGPAVTDLGKMLPFKNFKVDAKRRPDGTIKHTYKLKEGISEINIADDILNKELGV